MQNQEWNTEGHQYLQDTHDITSYARPPETANYWQMKKQVCKPDRQYHKI